MKAVIEVYPENNSFRWWDNRRINEGRHTAPHVARCVPCLMSLKRRNGVTFKNLVMEKFARRCDITGRGINEGYVFGEGERYAGDKEHALLIAKEYGYDSLEEAYEDEAYYYTEWEELDDDFYYDADGNEYEV